MNKLTKLMLASALLATSGFAMEGTVSTLSEAINIKEKGIVTIGTNDVVLTGSMTLATSGTTENVAQLVVDKGRTFKIESGTLQANGDGDKKAKMLLGGTLKVTECDLDEDGSVDPATVDLSNVEIKDQGTEKYVKSKSHGDYSSAFTGFDADKIANNEFTTGTSNGLTALYYDGSYWVQYPTGCAPENYTLNQIEEAGSYYTLGEDNDLIVDTSITVIANRKGAYERLKLEKTYSGVIDLSGLRTYDFSKTSFNVDEAGEVNYSENIKNIKPGVIAEVKLPFNCKFSGIDLTNVEKVTYDVLTVGQSTGAGIENGIITRVVTEEEKTYGNYKGKSELGVETEADGTPHSVDGIKEDINLSAVVINEDLNIAGVKLDTDCLDSNSMEIDSETTYNFGLKGAIEISVTKSGSAAEGTKLVLLGDNSNYTPSTVGNVTMPDVVEFAVSNSLLPFSFTYNKGIFSGTGQSSSIATGMVVKFDDGVDVRKGHILDVSGSLTL